jgi:hypothetical protein
MSEATVRRSKTPLTSALLVVLLIAVPLVVLAQGGRGGRGGAGGGAPVAAPAGQAPAPAAGGAAAQAAGQGGGAPAGAAAGARGAAPVDLTGYWVSLVTEDWIERMSPDSPPSGVPRGGRGGGGGGGGGNRGGAGAPAPVPAAPGSEQCRVYAAGGSMRVPGRLHITWADDNTLKVDMDAGTQTRLLHFNATVPAGTPKSLQGYSVATWEVGGRGGGGFGGGGNRGGAAPPAPRWGNLKVVTTNMSSGYLLSSRSTYSDNAVLTESFARHSDFGMEYLTIIASLEDGAGNPRVVSSTFKKEADGAKFAPTGCEVVR